MRGRLRQWIQPLLWKGYRWYLQKKRWYHYDGLAVCVYPTVFHPGLLWTTKQLLGFVRGLELSGKRVLELGAGSGLIALWTSRAGALTSASDINPAALRSMAESARHNQLSLTLYESDLFDSIPPERFDYILINPPFYPGEAHDDRERAFFCGPDFEYFRRLFAQLQSYCSPTAEVYMILTDDCALHTIDELAAAELIVLRLCVTHRRWGERQLIYRLEFLEVEENPVR
ncbi:MAG: methyltransferase [Bacteroidota bacterium]